MNPPAGAGWPAPALALLLTLSLAVQWLGLLVPFTLVQTWLADTVQPLFATETFLWPRYSPLLRQFGYLTQAHFQFAWWRAGPDRLALALIGAALLVGAGLLTRHLGSQTDSPDLRTPWSYGVALGLITLVLLLRYQVPLSGETIAATAAQITAHESPDDAILHLRADESAPFANLYHGRLPVYGPLPTGSLDSTNEAWLARWEAQYRRIWIVPDSMSPDQSGWERALRSRAFLLWEESVAGQRMALYAFPTAQPLTETGVGVEFGNPPWARLNGYGYTGEAHPGGELLVTLAWESLRPVAENYHVFVHLLDEAGTKVAQRDGQPLLWLRPTSTWQPGESIQDRYGMLLDEALPPGRYYIHIGLYDAATGERQPASAGPGDAVELGPIVVEPVETR